MEVKQSNNAKIPNKKYIFILATLMMLGMFIVISNFSGFIKFDSFPGAVVAACLEAVVTAIITVFLLKAQTTEQTESELKKERFAVLFAKKSETYDAFLKDLVVIANRGSITKEELMKLGDDLNFKVGMYISDMSNDIIAEQLNIIGSKHDTDTIKECVFKIAQELKNDLQVSI